LVHLNFDKNTLNRCVFA